MNNILAALSLVLLCSVACSHTEEKPDLAEQAAGAASTAPSDADARTKIVGTWHEAFESTEAQVRYAGDSTYRADGTFAVNGKMNYQGQDMDAVGKGTYRIEAGEICYTFTEGSGPMEENLGKEICETLLEVSDTKVRYRDHNEQQVTEMTRVEDPG